MARISASIVLLLVSVLALGDGVASGHTPHDDVDDIAMSPNFAKDRTVFVIAGGRLLRSTNEGDSWTNMVRGLTRPAEQGKSLARVVIAPSDPQRMYLTSRVDGFFRSSDAGITWEQANDGLKSIDVTVIAVSSVKPDLVLAAGTLGGLARSTDGGRSWSNLPGFGRVTSLAFEPGGTRVLAGESSGRISFSDDDGDTWSTSTAPSNKATINTIAPAGGSAVFAGTDKGKLLHSADRGATFKPIGRGLPGQPILSVLPSPKFAEDKTVWVSTYSNGSYRSSSGGLTWTKDSAGLTTDPQAVTVKVSEFRRMRAALGADGRIVRFMAGFDGLFRSAGREDWRPLETLSEFVVGLAVSPSFSQDKTLIVMTYVKGAYVSRDGGMKWTASDEGLLTGKISDGNKVADVRRLHNVVFSPNYALDKTLFSATWTAFLRSTDQGRTWSQIQVVGSGKGQLRQFVIAVSPNYSSDHTIFMGTRQGDVFRSNSRGDAKTWSKVANVGARIRSLILSPQFASDRTMYAGTEKGVFKSEDQGMTWARNGPAAFGMLAISPNYGSDGTVLAGTLDGLFRTKDKGRSWEELTSAPLGRAARVEALGLSPDYANDHTMLVSVGGVGLFRSTDGGDHFRAVGVDLLAANHIIADFTNPTSQPLQFSPSFAKDGTVFGYAGQDVVKSTDRGETWRVLDLPSLEEFLRSIGGPTGTGTRSDSTGKVGAPATTGPTPTTRITRRRAAELIALAGGILGLVGLGLGFYGATWYSRRREGIRSGLMAEDIPDR